MTSKHNTVIFIEKAKKVHGDKFNYSLVNYKTSADKVSIVCDVHGVFNQRPNDHLRGNGCPGCGVNTRTKIRTSTVQEFIHKGNATHDSKYDYSKVVYKNSKTPVIIGCPVHGWFTSTPTNHITRKSGCPICANSYKAEHKRKSLVEFKSQAYMVHGTTYAYDDVEYKSTHDKINILCHEHGVFKQAPVVHLRGIGCPKCQPQGFSKKSIRWLTIQSTDNNLYIEHAGNVGEFKIPGTRFRADGYCRETNTIYEFYGDAVHGNPQIFKPEELCHPFNKRLTSKQLYDRTVTREQTIINMGYNLITCWESDFRDNHHKNMK
jgi:hypothetical protein